MTTTRWTRNISLFKCLGVVGVIICILVIALCLALFGGIFSTPNNIKANSPDDLVKNNFKSSRDSWIRDSNQTRQRSSNEEFDAAPFPSSVDVSLYQSNLTDSDFSSIKEVERIYPRKILEQSLHEDDLLYESEKNRSSGFQSTDNKYPHHITGHYRNKSSKIWDPHPQYEIDAFGMRLILILNHDADFIHEDIKVTHVWPNETLRKKDEHKEYTDLQGCFYKGHVRGDDKSVVSVSLCGGMKGHIRTSSGSYFIQPIEKYTNENTNIKHAFYRIPYITSETVPDDLAEKESTDKSKIHCDLPDSHDQIHLDDDIIEIKSLDTKLINSRRKRNVDPNYYNQNRYQHQHHTRNSNYRSHQENSNYNYNTRRNQHDPRYQQLQQPTQIKQYSDYPYSEYHHYQHVNQHQPNQQRTSVMGNNEYTVEVLVAVDRKMQEYHGDNLKSYVLTLMSIVSSIYADASIGNSIKIAVVHIMYVETDLVRDGNLGNGVSASNMLLEFCRMKQTHVHSHDTALLLTREQICRSADPTKCDTLGLAELGTMCKPQSCAIVQDNGLSAAFTIAHELGHVLNMPHDDDRKCDPHRGSIETKQNIMSRMLDHNTHPWSWSNCSRNFVTEFLDKSQTNCLLDKPTKDLIEKSTANTRLAGEKFTDNQQCELVFGPGSRICSYMPPCTRLWCSENGQEAEGCRTQHMPWADGTKCVPEDVTSKTAKETFVPITRDGYWCQKGDCVARNRSVLIPVHGGWSSWSSYGECSRTCGGGIHVSFRSCNNPAPVNGGNYCIGKKNQYKACNTQDCPDDTLDFRGEQCSKFDNGKFQLAQFEKAVWVPKYGLNTPDNCKLFCRVDKSTNYFAMAPKVIDGTPCSYLGFDKCINGVCVPAGCDNELHSTAKLDKCGVCQGNNETCENHSGNMTHNKFIEKVRYNAGYSYYSVVTIPKGATNIEITQPGYEDDQNYIALKNDQGEYLLNGIRHIEQHHKTIQYGGLTLEYNGGNQKDERINSTYAMQLKRELNIEILSFQRMRPIEDYIIKFSYTKSNPERVIFTNNIPNYDEPYYVPQKKHYHWNMSEWSECSKSCNGKQSRKAVCVELNSKVKAADQHCARTSVKPRDDGQECNTDCSFGWEKSKSECSHTCGEGSRTIKYECVQRFERASNQAMVVEPENCSQQLKSVTEYEPCFGPCKDVVWSYGDWGECSQSCNGGKQNRTATCLSHHKGSPVDNKYCSKLPKQELLQHCNQDINCAEWSYGEETPAQTEIAYSSTHVFYKQRELSPDLRGQSYVKYEWKTGRWGECSRSCLGGIKNRIVRCTSEHETVDDAYCNASPRPTNETICNEFRCPQWIFGNYSPCNKECKQIRQVSCHDHRGQEVDTCSFSEKPAHEFTCCHIRWRAEWKPCSVSCGVGVQTKVLVCMKLGKRSRENPVPRKKGEKINPAYCSHLKMPQNNITKPCKKYCDFKWETSPWSKCSVGCGFNGFATRTVYCTNGKQTSTTECSNIQKPLNTKSCENREHCRWKIGKWKTCSCAGFQKRKTTCWDELINKEANACYETRRPEQRKRCPAPNCNCAAIQRNKRTRTDGEYKLSYRGREMQIYCHGMHTTHPLEYLTLKSGIRENYSLFYKMRARNIDSCESLDSREMEDTHIKYGTTRFNKIRLNITSMQVVDDDYTFAQVHGTPQTFSSAGDCFSTSERCPQGDFSLNLEGTGFRIRPSTHWETKGTNSTMNFLIKLEEPYLKVRARCGGYCGSCRPSSRTGLHLDIH